MAKLIAIRTCLDCPHFHQFQDKVWCGKVNKEHYKATIPEWCPLPDAPKEKV